MSTTSSWSTDAAVIAGPDSPVPPRRGVLARSKYVRLVPGLIAGMALVAALVAVSIAVVLFRDRPYRHLRRAAAAMERGDMAEARAWLVVPELAPETRERALLVKARIALAEDRPRDAVVPLNAIDPGGPHAAEVALLKGRTLLAAGQTLQALRWLRLAVDTSPDLCDGYRWLAVAAHDHGAVDLAVWSLEALTRLQPDDPRPWRVLGQIHADNKDPTSARVAYEESLRLEPGQPQVRGALVSVLLEMGRYDDAERVVADHPTDLDPSLRLRAEAKRLDARGDREALAALLRSDRASMSRDPEILRMRGRIEREDGRFDQALVTMNQAVEADPYSPDVYYERANVFRMLRRLDECRADLARHERLDRAIKDLSRLDHEASRRPTDAEVRLRLGDLCSSLGKAETAESWFRSALACDPNNREALSRLRSLSLPTGHARPLAGAR